MTLGVNDQIAKIPADDNFIDYQELKDMFLFLLREQKSVDNRITSTTLYKLAIDQWHQGKLKTKPFFQLVKSWVILATERGLIETYWNDSKETIAISS